MNKFLYVFIFGIILLNFFKGRNICIVNNDYCGVIVFHLVKIQADRISSKPQITVTWFRPDQKKTGGAYVTTTGQLKKLDDYAGALIMMGGERIVIENILDIQ